MLKIYCTGKPGAAPEKPKYRMVKLLAVAFIACMIYACGDRTTMVTAVINGYEADSVYLYKVVNEYYGSYRLMKAIPVNGGEFRIQTDTIKPFLYCLSLQNRKNERMNDYTIFFIEPGNMKVTISKGRHYMKLYAEGSQLQDQYAEFMRGKDLAGNRQLLDSLDGLFYAAREKGDSIEMQRIKEDATPVYDESRRKKDEYIDEAIKRSQGTYFGLYLYYAYRFQNGTYSTKSEINSVKTYITGFDKQAVNSEYFSLIEKRLEQFEQCAVGSVAPAIVGIDMNGKTVALENFRGRHVIVDFWSSGCSWCRLETPNLLKAYEDFKDKGFTVFGVSSDHRKESWLRAIEEDKSYWDQVLLPKDSIRTVFDRYCIAGIPHILLVDPDGVIIAKELRGEDIYNAVKNNMETNM